MTPVDIFRGMVQGVLLVIVCFPRGVWRTFTSGVWLDGNLISGHDGQERPDGTIYCTTCGDNMTKGE